jgi:hypothetical protein
MRGFGMNRVIRALGTRGPEHRQPEKERGE